MNYASVSPDGKKLVRGSRKERKRKGKGNGEWEEGEGESARRDKNL